MRTRLDDFRGECVRMHRQPCRGVDRDRSIIFLHIPKTAGTTLHRIIERQYSADGIHSFGSDNQGAVRDFKSMPEAQRAKIKVLKGHMAFGLHKFLPQPSVYIGMLRDPTERVISYYYHILRDPSHYLHQHVVSHQLSLKDVVSSELTPDLDNGQVRLVSGVWNEVPRGSCFLGMLDQAKRNIEEHFAVTGLVEEFDASLMLLMRAFGWRWYNLLYVRENVAPDRPTRQDLSQDTLAVIRQYNELDLALYDFVRDAFEAEKRDCRYLAARLRVFQMFNRASNLLLRPARRL